MSLCYRTRNIICVADSAAIAFTAERIDQRRAPPRPIFAGVKAIGAEGMRDIGITVGAMRCIGLSAKRMGNIIWTDQMPVLGHLLIQIMAEVFSKAWCNPRGNSLPRFSARRRMPLQAFALKKYRCGTAPVSKMSDNEDAAAPLWNSEMLSVKNSVGEPIPALPQASEEGSKRASSVDRQDAGYVLPNQPTGPQASSKRKEFDGELTTLAIHSLSESGDAEILAGRSADKKVNWLKLIGPDVGKIAMQRNGGIAVAQHGARECLDL